MKNYVNLRKAFILVMTFCASVLVLPSFSFAGGILGGDIIVKDTGNVSVTFDGSSASYTSTLYLEGYGALFSNRTAIGTTVDVGSFNAGQELSFYILVENTGNTFYTGAGALNADGVAHALVENLGDGTKVSFEDLWGGGDRDYNDVIFTFNNTSVVSGGGPTIAQPEPSTILLFGSGLLGLGAWRLRKSKS